MEKITCGCTCHELDFRDMNTILFNGLRWNPICALKESIRLLAKTNEEISKARAEIKQLQKIEKKYKSLVSYMENVVKNIQMNIKLYSKIE